MIAYYYCMMHACLLDGRTVCRRISHRNAIAVCLELHALHCVAVYLSVYHDLI